MANSLYRDVKPYFRRPATQGPNSDHPHIILAWGHLKSPGMLTKEIGSLPALSLSLLETADTVSTTLDTIDEKYDVNTSPRSTSLQNKVTCAHPGTLAATCVFGASSAGDNGFCRRGVLMATIGGMTPQHRKGCSAGLGFKIRSVRLLRVFSTPLY
ncbi:hypothetical protein JB92DRAFT_2829664 [Gautieria morchelliformis]|nr:hypothetical protein JB92DRAFT_2829664 [Gautieria morchelliformis]